MVSAAEKGQPHRNLGKAVQKRRQGVAGKGRRPRKAGAWVRLLLLDGRGGAQGRGRARPSRRRPEQREREAGQGCRQQGLEDLGLGPWGREAICLHQELEGRQVSRGETAAPAHAAGRGQQRAEAPTA